MPASISSKTIVSPPATAAIASATRESSPPEAVSATGPNGRPAFGRIRNADVVGAGRARVALAEHDLELPVAEADRLQLRGHGRGERAGGRPARRPQLGVEPVDLRLRRVERLGRGSNGVVAVGERVELASGPPPRARAARRTSATP